VIELTVLKLIVLNELRDKGYLAQDNKDCKYLALTLENRFYCFIQMVRCQAAISKGILNHISHHQTAQCSLRNVEPGLRILAAQAIDLLLKAAHIGLL